MPENIHYFFRWHFIGGVPLNDAAYVPAPVDKIFGTSGPYVIKFNATTGSPEAIVRLSSPMYGDCRICYHSGTGMLFAAGHNEINNRWFALTYPSRDIWRVDPTSLAVTPLSVGSWLTNFEPNVGDVWGPQWIKAAGSYLYFQHESRDRGFYWARVNASNFADHNMGGVSPTPPMNTEQFEVAGGFVYHIDPGSGDINRCFLAGGVDDSMNIFPAPITAIQLMDDGLLYLVCGNSSLIRIDLFGGGLTTTFNLASATGFPAAPCDPVRLKSVSPNKIYIPCMAANGIIIWDIVGGSGDFRSGFSNPVDIVESGVFPNTKKWAVQNSPTGLREII